MVLRPPPRKPGHTDAVPAGLSLRDGFADPLSTVAGLSVRSAKDGGATAAAVLLDATTLERRAAEIVRIGARRDARPDGAADNALQALLEVLAALPRVPDLALVDGHGIAHLRGVGLAARFGLAADVPSIGVATDIVAGSGPEPHQTRGAYTALRDPARRQAGWLLRSRPSAGPLVVSPAHRVAMASAADLVMRFTRSHRLPEPLRLARSVLARETGAKPGDETESPPES